MKTIATVEAKTRTHPNETTMTGYFISSILGLLGGGFTYCQINLGQIGDIIVSLVAAVAMGIGGAGGKHIYDKWGKPWVNKRFRKRKR